MASVFIGWDPREAAAFAVARSSCRRHLNLPVPIFGLVLDQLKAKGLYTRPTEIRPSAADRPVMWDVISNAPMSTEHANARFLVHHLAGSGWALFVDGDVLFRGNVSRLFESLSPEYAVYCVKHRHEPQPGFKMDHQIQTRYARKNWSSVMAINCDHPANKALTVDLINSVPGRDLHRFCWLEDDLIGELSPEWNFLVGHTHAPVNPKIVHFTDGCPDMQGYDDVAFADEWRQELHRWAS
jgi:hypothetical protein